MAIRNVKAESIPKKRLFDNTYSVKAKNEVADNIARVLLREDELPTDRKFYALMTSKMKSNDLGGLTAESKTNIDAVQEEMATGRLLYRPHRGSKKEIAKLIENKKAWVPLKKKFIQIKQMNQIKYLTFY